MLTALMLFGFAVLFAIFVFAGVCLVAMWQDRRERLLQHERDINILRVNKFLQ